ncbi:PTS sugar transporter subunit IIA [Streptococcus dentapri]|uniref:PTS sugar transporter subunit IIA n=1 Tax=Streptococcus dentapri TaxID=573564 RepID=A0ABV8CZJ2_9STRE
MKYLVLVSHGGLAEGLKTSLAMFAGDKINQVLAFGLKDGKSVDEFAVEVKEDLAAQTKPEDDFIILADIVGGSPLTTFLNVLEEKGKLGTAVVIGGMNLTAALTAVVMKDLAEGDALAENILSEASSALQQFKVAAAEADDEDDDI